MKKMKRLAALFLAVVMIMAMGMTAMAAGGKITIENPQKDKTYTAYKIFTAISDTSNTNTAYRLDSSSAAFTQLKAMADAEEPSNGVVITSTTVTDVYNVEVTDAPAFAAYLKTLATADSLTDGIDGAPNNGKYEISTTADGYYFVDTNSGSLTNLDIVQGDISIYDKNETPTVTKETVNVDENNVEVGQSVPYVVNGTVPSVVGYRVYNYTVSDKMGRGLTFNANNLKVTVGTTVIYENGAVTVDAPAGFSMDLGKADSDFEMHLNLVKDNGASVTDPTERYEALYPVGTAIKVEYSATVNSEAAVTTNANATRNEVKLVYSNDPSDSTSMDEYEPTPVDLTTANIVINKYVGNIETPTDDSVKLAGAKFVLKNEAGQYYKVVDGAVTWVAENGDVVESNADASAKFTGLKDGKYYLVETEAPAGYNLMSEELEIVVNHEEDDALVIEPKGDVPNYAGAVLPSTGGIGTTIFYVVGGIMVLGAAVLLITKKRMSAK